MRPVLVCEDQFWGMVVMIKQRHDEERERKSYRSSRRTTGTLIMAVVCILYCLAAPQRAVNMVLTKVSGTRSR